MCDNRYTDRERKRQTEKKEVYKETDRKRGRDRKKSVSQEIDR